MNACIVGNGIVGKATGFVLEISDFVYKNEELSPDYNYYFICVPTPTCDDGTQDVSIIEERLKELESFAKNKKDKIVIIRSTILPGTTDFLSKKYDLIIAHIPEFLSENTAIEDEKNPEFVVIGCRDIIVRENIKKELNFHFSENKFILTDPTTAELIKYSMNSFFSLKVVFANQLWDVSKECGANYEKVKEALEKHKWGSKNGWDVWHNCKRGFYGKCLPKDLYAFIKKFRLPLLEIVRDINKKLISTTI